MAVTQRRFRLTLAPLFEYVREGRTWRWLTMSALGRLFILSSVGFCILMLTAQLAVWLGVFPTFGPAMWSAVIHFVTPSAIANDATGQARFVGIIQAIAGLIFYAGVLVAVLSQAVARSLERLAAYEAPLRSSGHLLFIGGYDTMDYILAALEEDMRIFEDQQDIVPNEIVIVVPHESSAQRDELQDRWQRAIPSVTVHTIAGDPRLEITLKRVSAHRASKIVVGPMQTDLGPLDADYQSVECLYSLMEYLNVYRIGRNPPIFVAMRRARHAESFYGSSWAEMVHVIAQDRSLGSRLRLAVMHPEYADFFGIGTGNRIGTVDVLDTDYSGLTFEEVRTTIPGALTIGVVRATGTDDLELTAPPLSDYELISGDLVMVMWHSREAVPAPPRRPGEGVRLLMVGFGAPSRELLAELARHGDPIESILVLTQDKAWRSSIPSQEVPTNLEEIIGNPDYPTVIVDAVEKSQPNTIVVSSEYSEDLDQEDARTTFAALHIHSHIDTSNIPVFTLTSKPGPRSLFESTGMIPPTSAVEAHALNTALAVSRYRSGRVLREMFGSTTLGELDVVMLSDVWEALDLDEESPTVSFKELISFFAQTFQVPMCAHLESGVLWAPPHNDLELGPNDSVLVIRHGFGSLTDAAW